MRIVTKEVYETDDGAIFNSVQEAHDYLDQTYRTHLDVVAKDINTMTGCRDIAACLDKHIDHLVEAKQIMMDKIMEKATTAEPPTSVLDSMTTMPDNRRRRMFVCVSEEPRLAQRGDFIETEQGSLLTRSEGRRAPIFREVGARSEVTE